MWVKICGVTTLDDALHAQACGADAVGLNLHPGSPRCVSPARAAALAAALDCATALVAVDLPEAELAAIVAEVRPTFVQLHGDQPPGFGASLGVPLLRAWRARQGVLDAIRADAAPRFLLDAYVPGAFGGTGRRVDLDLARRAAALGQLVLAGGLTPDNVAAVVAAARPFGVDVASGVEAAPGRKDPDKVRAFIQRARGSAGPSRPS
ncbi:MAG: phosphoribosylanthranilate isomerase [Alphaproteobacteria bacterium]|nr:phosphoribosylanthranilate isomerase [Alphaproteobacteria bacterium]